MAVRAPSRAKNTFKTNMETAMWLCARHLARLQGHAASVPELEGMFDGALVVTEITSADLSDVDDGQGGRL